MGSLSANIERFMAWRTIDGMTLEVELKNAAEEIDEANQHFEFLKDSAGKIMCLPNSPFAADYSSNENYDQAAEIEEQTESSR